MASFSDSGTAHWLRQSRQQGHSAHHWHFNLRLGFWVQKRHFSAAAVQTDGEGSFGRRSVEKTPSFDGGSSRGFLGGRFDGRPVLSDSSFAGRGIYCFPYLADYRRQTFGGAPSIRLAKNHRLHRAPGTVSNGRRCPAKNELFLARFLTTKGESGTFPSALGGGVPKPRSVQAGGIAPRTCSW